MRKDSPQSVTVRGPGITCKRIWVFVFLVWVGFISGVFQGFWNKSWGTGPGVKQYLALQKLLSQRETERQLIEQEIQNLEELAKRLKTDATLQEREIRRVLGYLAADEMIFDFTSSQFPSN